MTTQAFEFLDRPDVTGGHTEIRGPYYSAIGPAGLGDLLDAVGPVVDTVKIGPPLLVMPATAVDAYIETCHRRGVAVSTGGVIEYVLTRGSAAVDRYFAECADRGFDIIEISAGMVSVPAGDYLRLVESAKRVGVRVTAEIGIQFGAGGSSSVEDLESLGTSDLAWAVRRAVRAVDAGADLIMLESEGVTEGVRTWRTDVPGAFVAELGMDRLMFEAADPPVFRWYVRNYGPDVNLFVDHSQVFQLACLRAGVWGESTLFGRVHGYTSGETR
jgi:phosphosulfolactate synthase (CoM biosynthesis protein A)